MALDWSVIRAEHVMKACEMMIADKHGGRGRAQGLFVMHAGNELSAKQVLRVAYRIANRMPSDAEVKFSSGDGTINLLRKLGFEAIRREPSMNAVADPK